MSIQATAEEIASLLELVALDAGMHEVSPEAFAARREASQRRVASPLLDRYQLLLGIGRDPAVVPIAGGSCTGCHVRLPTMVEYQARRSPAIHTCPHCRRMLYAPELLSGERSRESPAPARKQRPRRRAPGTASVKAQGLG
jgi:predicted  nucleic acid-binding Zn-ribbon protein